MISYIWLFFLFHIVNNRCLYNFEWRPIKIYWTGRNKLKWRWRKVMLNLDMNCIYSLILSLYWVIGCKSAFCLSSLISNRLNRLIWYFKGWVLAKEILSNPTNHTHASNNSFNSIVHQVGNEGARENYYGAQCVVFVSHLAMLPKKRQFCRSRATCKD